MPTINKPKKKREYSKDPESTRKKRQSVYNTTTWRKMREAKLMRNPLCEICQLEGRITLAEHIHHLSSFMEYDDNEMINIAFDSENLCSVCRRCHNRCHTGDLQGTKTLADIRQYINAHKEK